jgi:hypothetical protein
VSGNHAIIAPSSLDLTVHCQAWVRLARRLPPEPDTPETMEGTAADWVAKQYAAGNEVAYGTPIPLPGDFKVDYDMIHGARMWADVLGYGAVSGSPIVCGRIHPTDCWGEPDGWQYFPIEQLIRLPEYKYGFGVHDVFEHWQLIGYAAGILETLGLDDMQTWVEFVVVQPRAHHKDGPVRRWKVLASKLRGLINKAHDAAMRAWPPGMLEAEAGAIPMEAIPLADATAGTHCVHCPARGVCETYQHGNGKVVEFIGRSQHVALDPDAVGVELAILQDAQEFIKGRITSLEAQAEAYLRAGKRVPNFIMEPTGSRLEWLPTVTEQELMQLGELTGKSPYKPEPALNSRNSRVVTPTQALKAKIIDAAVMPEYAARSSGGMKLARISDNQAVKAFGVKSV